MDIKGFMDKSGVTISGPLTLILGYLSRKYYDPDISFEVIGAVAILVMLLVNSVQRYAKWKGWIPPAAGFLLIAISGNAYAQEKKDPNANRIVISSRNVDVWNDQFDSSGESTGIKYATTTTVAEVFISPMVLVNAIQIPLDRRAEFTAGVDVGGCWAIHWSPAWWGKATSSPFLSFGPCLEVGLSVGAIASGPEGETFLAATVLAALSVADWVAIGVGWRQRLSLSEEGRDNGSPVITIGLTAATF